VDRVICISQFTADEVLTLLRLPPDKISVVYNGCEFHPEEALPAEQAPDFQVPSEFFLFVGSLEPGKNLSLLIQVYRLAEKERIALPPLVVVGARWCGLTNEGQPPPGWHYLGRQPDSVLIYLFRRAMALVFPSKYEGFGLPVAEAMALGCPVICSPVASLPEVGGKAALFTELNVRAYFLAMQKVTKDASLRDELKRHGLKQSAKFSWNRCAEETLGVYRQA
jgi:alpha-1,3-rhamnosyl/mannosyltransferase